MICYRDKSYCLHSATMRCTNRKCRRFLPPETDTRGLPVDWRDMKTETCGYISNPVYEQLKHIVGPEDG